MESKGGVWSDGGGVESGGVVGGGVGGVVGWGGGRRGQGISTGTGVHQVPAIFKNILENVLLWLFRVRRAYTWHKLCLNLKTKCHNRSGRCSSSLSCDLDVCNCQLMFRLVLLCFVCLIREFCLKLVNYYLATDLSVTPMAWLGPPVTTPSWKYQELGNFHMDVI